MLLFFSSIKSSHSLNWIECYYTPGGVRALSRTALPVPGQGFSFGTLHRAQARGDYAAMLAGGRRILRLELGSAVEESLRAVVNAAAELSACPN